MKCVTIDLAVESAERRHFEERERAQVEYEFVEDGIIDDRVDDMTDTEIFEAIEDVENWNSLAKLCADSQATPDNYARLGKAIGGMIRDYAKRLVEMER